MRFVVVEAEAKALGWVERRPHPEGAALSGRKNPQIIVIRECTLPHFLGHAHENRRILSI